MADSKYSEEIKFYKPKLRFIIPISNFQYPKKLFNEFKGLGIDKIYCLSVNDAFVMNAWGNDQKVQGKIRMIGVDQTFATNLGLELNLEARGMGIRIQRFSMLIDNNVVKSINVEGPGKFEVSSAEVLLKQATEIF